MDFQNVTVTVPAHRIGDLLAYAAELARDGHAAASRDRSESVTGLDPQAVKEAYTGGQSARWRPFLEILAGKPDEWVEWHFLCEQIDFTPNQAAGMLGAAERRCRQHPPYEKKVDDGKSYFRMPGHVAAVVRELTKSR